MLNKYIICTWYFGYLEMPYFIFKHLFTIWDIVNKSRSPYKLHASFRKQTFITFSTRKNTQVAVENRSKIVWQLNSFNKFMLALSYV